MFYCPDTDTSAVDEKRSLVQNLSEDSHWQMDLLLIESIDKLNLITYEEVIDFIASGRKEKSIKKALHNKVNANSSSYKYNYFLDYAICRAFRDSNLVVRALNSNFIKEFEANIVNFTQKRDDYFNEYATYLTYKDDQLSTFEEFSNMHSLPDIYIHAIDYEKFDALTIEGFLRFLIGMYDEKRVVHFMESCETSNKYFLDLMYQISDLFFAVNSSMLSLYSKPKLSFSNLHDEFSSLVNTLKGDLVLKKKYVYSSQVKNLNLKENGYEIELVTTPSRLVQMGRELKNCLGSYVSFMEVNQLAIFSLFKSNKLIGAISVNISEFNAYKLKEYAGVANMPLKNNDETFLTRWAKSHGIEKPIY